MDSEPKPQTASRIPQMVSRIALVFLILGILAAILVFQYAGPMPSIFRRNLGAGTSFIPGWIEKCDGYNIETHKFGQCTALIDCVYREMKQVEVADAAIGGTIAGLLPTILIILGMTTHTFLHLDFNSDACLAPPPKELVQQGLVSPHRAIALSCFCIGLPLGVLFQELGPTRERSSAEASTGGGVVRWELHFAALSSNRPWLHRLGKIGGDIVILACMGVVLWRAWAINQAVMVPWKCETPVMTFAWTVACMFWVVVALLLLHSMVEDIHFEDLIHFDAETKSPAKYCRWEVWLLPYTLRAKKRDVDGIRVVWKMPERSWIRSPLVYYCVIEAALAAVIYVYGTLVWLSALFLGATSALKYVSLTVALYTVARIVSGIL